MESETIRLLAVFCMCVVITCGCTTGGTLVLDPGNPAVTVSHDGIRFGDRKVDAREVAEILDDYSVPRNRTIHIRIDRSVKNLSGARFLMGCLAKAGYTRSILVTERQARSMAVEGDRKGVRTPVRAWSRDDTPDDGMPRRRKR